VLCDVRIRYRGRKLHVLKVHEVKRNSVSVDAHGVVSH
jgi:hypothetical protein